MDREAVFAIILVIVLLGYARLLTVWFESRPRSCWKQVCIAIPGTMLIIFLFFRLALGLSLRLTLTFTVLVIPLFLVYALFIKKTGELIKRLRQRK